MVNHVAVFAALGDPKRAAMVSQLSRRDRTVSELAAHVSISLPATLKHVQVLEGAGLATRTKHGRTVTVALQPRALADSEAWLHRTRTFWQTQLGSLAASFQEER